MNEQNLQENLEKLAERVKAKQAEKTAIDSELGGLIARLVDADLKARPGLIARRAELVNLAALLRDELAELTNRRDAAELAIYEFAENNAAAELHRLDGIGRDARRAMNAAAESHLRFINRVGRHAQTDEEARDLVKMEMEKARTAAESQIARQNTERAAANRDQAKAAAAEARRRLGVG